MTNLSPSAQAVLATYEKVWGQGYGSPLAAALRAAADQVAPIEPLHGGDQRWETERDARQICRRKLLAIAAELEGGNG